MKKTSFESFSSSTSQIVYCETRREKQGLERKTGQFPQRLCRVYSLFQVCGRFDLRKKVAHIERETK